MARVHRRRCLLVRRPWAIGLLVAIAVAGISLAGYRVWPHGNPVPRAAGAGQDFAAGAMTLQVCPAGHRTNPGPVSRELLYGTRFDLGSWRGRVAVFDSWASWCAPCRVEAKDLNSVFAATKPQGVEFPGVDIMDDRSPAQAFVDAFAVPYPSLFDPAGRKRVTAIELETVLRDVVAEPAGEAVAGG